MRKGQSAKVCLRQIIPALRAIYYGGTVVLNAKIDNGTLVIERSNSVVSHSHLTVGDGRVFWGGTK